MGYNIFVLSTTEKAKNDTYMIGKHKGSQQKLLEKYVTILIDPVIYFHQRVSNYAAIENKIKSKLDANRIDNGEWINLKLSHIKEHIWDVINSNEINKTIPKYYTINDDPNDFIESDDSYREDCQYPHSIHHDDQIIGGFMLLRELNDNEEIRIDNIKMLRDFGSEQIINLFIDILFDYLDQHYASVRNYVFEYPTIRYLTNNFNSDSDCDSDSHYEYRKFVNCLMTKFHDKYHYYPITLRGAGFGKNDLRCQCIIISKYKYGLTDKFKKNNVCDFLLSFGSNDEITVHSNYINHAVPKCIKEKPKDIACRRKFKVVREKKFRDEHGDLRSAKIKIIFDEPVTFMSCGSVRDVYMKFIVNNTDYTSATGQLSEFSFDYRFNKLFYDFPIVIATSGTLIPTFGTYRYLYTICGFSYFESDENYPQLCTMVNRIYSDFK
jgi:hypothetical protein